MNPSRILVLGSGGREHALAWRLARDAHGPTVWVAPGNDGMEPEFQRLAIKEFDTVALLEAIRTLAIDLVVIGPEAPLAAGVGDALAASGVRVFGASQAAARLESSKWFAKQVMEAAGVPTARAAAFEDVTAAVATLPDWGPPWVVKADGLAAGKGVLVTSERHEAESFIRECLTAGRFGAGEAKVVLEEYLEGEEASIIAICDGERAVLLPAARDHKRALDGDRGPNTGGMGAFAPTPAVTPEIEREVLERVILPVLRTMAARGTPFRGALYAGLMLTVRGPRVIEFNARFGDPETQCIVPLLTGSFSGLLAGAAAGALDPDAVGRAPLSAVAIALVDERYPGTLRGDGEIRGLDSLVDAGVHVFHAAIRRDGSRVFVNGGRAAYVMAVAEDGSEAREAAYRAIGKLSGEGWRVRRDIGQKLGVHTVRSME